MGLSSEAWAKLGVDTSSVAGDLAGANKAFDKFLGDLKGKGGDAGAGVGEKFARGFGKKLTDSRHLSTALASALGLNIESISEKIAAAITGGTRAAWEEMGKLAEQNAALIAEKMRLAMSPKQIQGLEKRKLRDAQDDFESTKKNQGEGFWEKMLANHSESPKTSRAILSFFGLVQSEAARANELHAKGNKIIEAELPLDREKAALKESHRKLAEYEEELIQKTLSGEELITSLQKQKAAVQAEITSGALTDLQIDERKRREMELQSRIDAESLKIGKAKVEQAKKLADLQADLLTAKKQLAKSEEDAETKKADRGKQTVGEIAGMTSQGQKREDTGSWTVNTFGLSKEQAEAKQRAVEAERLQRQAEGMRMTGDVAGANSLFDQVGAKRQGLVDSGFAKSSEGDSGKMVSEAIKSQTEALQKKIDEITKIASGKMKAE